MTDATGLDDYTLLLSLTTAYLAFERLPRDKRPMREMGSIRKQIRAFDHAGMTSLMFAEIVLTLNPGADFRIVYELFGIEVEPLRQAG